MLNKVLLFLTNAFKGVQENNFILRISFAAIDMLKIFPKFGHYAYKNSPNFGREPFLKIPGKSSG